CARRAGRTWRRSGAGREPGNISDAVHGGFSGNPDLGYPASPEGPLMTKQMARAFGVFASLAVALSGSANANTITQNTSWKITRSGATATYQVVAYGDSIYAGYNGNLFSVLRRAGPWVDGEYLAKEWNANIQVVRRTKSGAKADDIYNNKIIGDRSYMQTTSTRVVMFEMCGNDYLQARSNLSGQTGACNFGVLDSALSACG